MQRIIDFIYNIVWSDALVYLCLLTGVYFTIRFKFPQITHFKQMFTLLFKSNRSEKGISSFQAFSLAVSGRVGTGNIAGVATAIGMGGPGAIFWMWVIDCPKVVFAVNIIKSKNRLFISLMLCCSYFLLKF